MKFLVKKAPEHFIRTVNDEISSLLNRHFDSYFPEAAYMEEDDKFSIPVEVTENDEAYDIMAEIPGVKKEHVDIDLDKNSITINATKEEEKESHGKNYKKSEFRYGEYSRTIYFPEDINTEDTQATLEHGILKVHAHKQHSDKEHKRKLKID